MNLLGDVTNNGLVRAVNSTNLLADTGAFTNNGTLDLITAGASSSLNLTGNGTYFSSTHMPSFTVDLDAALGEAEVTIQTNTYHTYNLELSPDLSPGSWSLVDSYTGDGALLTWLVQDVGDRVFFRVGIVD